MPLLGVSTVADDGGEGVVGVLGDDAAEHADTAKAATTIPTSGTRLDRRPREEDTNLFKAGTPTSHHAAGFRLATRAGWTSKRLCR